MYCMDTDLLDGHEMQLKEYRSLCISVSSVIEFFFGGSVNLTFGKNLAMSP